MSINGDIRTICQFYEKAVLGENQLKDETEVIEKISNLFQSLENFPPSDFSLTKQLIQVLKKNRFFSNENVKTHPFLSKVLCRQFPPSQEVFITQLIHAEAPLSVEALSNLIRMNFHTAIEQICEKVLKKDFMSPSMEMILTDLFEWACDYPKANKFLFPLYRAMDERKVLGAAILNQRILLNKACEKAPEEAAKIISTGKVPLYLFKVKDLLISASTSGKAHLVQLLIEKTGQIQDVQLKIQLLEIFIVNKASSENLIAIYFFLFPSEMSRSGILTFFPKWLSQLAKMGEKNAIEAFLSSLTESERITVLNGPNTSPLISLCSEENRIENGVEIARLYIQYGANEQQHFEGWAPINFSVKNHRIKIFNFLFECLSEGNKKRVVNTINERGNTLFGEACAVKNFKVIAKLLPFKPNILLYPQLAKSIFDQYFESFPKYLKKHICELCFEEICNLKENGRNGRVSLGTELVPLCTYIERKIERNEVDPKDFLKLKKFATRNNLVNLKKVLKNFKKANDNKSKKQKIEK